MEQLDLDHLHLKSRDAAAAADFYLRAFGGRLAARVERPGALRLVVELFGLRLFIEQVDEACPDGLPRPFRGMEHLAIRTDAIEATLQRCLAQGATLSQSVTVLSPQATIAFIDGPDGTPIELVQRRAAKEG